MTTCYAITIEQNMLDNIRENPSDFADLLYAVAWHGNEQPRHVGELAMRFGVIVHAISHSPSNACALAAAVLRDKEELADYLAHKRS